MGESMALTRRQAEVLAFARAFIREQGYPPSLEEIANHIGVSSSATVHEHLTKLEQKGVIRRTWNRGRSIEIVGDEVKLPHVTAQDVEKAASSRRYRAKQQRSDLYFIRHPAGYIKIGYSARWRSAAIGHQCSNPYPLVVELVLEGRGSDEKELHKRFASSHYRGEWFRPSSDLLEFIEENRNGFRPRIGPKFL